jgi:exonuclease III
MSLTIASSNVNNRADGQGQWNYISKISPDIVLLQECRHPHHYLGTAEYEKHKPYILWDNIEGMQKGVAIFTKQLPSRRLQFLKHRGRVLVAEIETHKGTPLFVVTIHGDTKVDVRQAINSILDDLSAAFKSAKNIIVAGDLNLTFHYRPSDVHVRDRLINEFNLINCTQFIDPKTTLNHGEIGTLKPKMGKQQLPHQDDYIFVSPVLGRGVKFEVIMDSNVPSDHYPVVTTWQNL